MFSDDFISYADDIIEAHQNKMINSYKNYLKQNQDFVEENYKPCLFIEAMLYQWLTIAQNPYSEINKMKNALTLDQILFGYQKEFLSKTILVNSDKYGIVYLPNFGYLNTGILSETIELHSDKKGKVTLKFKGNDVKFEQTKAYFLKGTNIEVCNCQLPYTDIFFENIDTQPFNFSEVVNEHLDLINDVFQNIKILRPKYYEWFSKIITKIQVYNIPKVVSFASMGMYSVPFVSTNLDRSKVFYFEDIIHQAAHNIFYAITYYERAKLFKHDPHTKIAQLLSNDDQRTLYSSFHGLFTQANINLYFDICLDKSIFEGKLNHEVKGRLSDNMKRWEKSLLFFSEQDVLSDLGALIFNELVSVYEYLQEKWSKEIQKYDTTNQPYIFDYAKFEELNPYTYE